MRIINAALLSLTLAGCSQPFEPPVVAALLEPANPATARIASDGPGVAYTQRPIKEPGDWRGLNDAQGPEALR